MKSYRILASAAPVLLGFVLIGCHSEPPTGVVTGTIKLGDVKLTTGTIVFWAKDGKLSGQGGIKDGEYKVDKAPLGECKITVFVPKAPPKAPSLPKDKELPKDAKEIPEDVVPVLIPEKYDDKDKSELTFDVKLGTNTFNIELKNQGSIKK